MYKKILVPLDGSKLAECALLHVEELSRGYGTEEENLVSVTEQVQARTRAPKPRNSITAATAQRIRARGQR